MQGSGGLKQRGDGPAGATPALPERWVTGGFLAICCVCLALLLPPALGVGWTLEEIATVVPVAPQWEYPAESGPAPAADGDGSAGWRFYSEGRRPLTLPVWGVIAAERFYPLMVDGHIGALPGYPYRWAAALWGPDASRIMAVLGGLGMLWMVFTLGRMLFGAAAGLLGAALLAVSPLVLFVHTWTNLGEQWSSWPRTVAHRVRSRAATRQEHRRRRQPPLPSEASRLKPNRSVTWDAVDPRPSVLAGRALALRRPARARATPAAAAPPQGW